MQYLSIISTIMTSTSKLLVRNAVLAASLMLSSLSCAYADGAVKNSTPEITRTDVERRINMAERLINKEQYDEAIRNLKLTVKQYRYNADAWKLLGFSHRQSGDIDAANLAYTRALKINRYHLGALEYQGKLFIAMGRLDDAKVNLRLMEEQCPVGCKEQRDLEAAISAAN